MLYNIKRLLALIKRDSNVVADFDCDYYINKYGDVKKSNLDPKLHYILYGKKEGRFKNELEELEATRPNNQGFDYYHRYGCNTLPPLEEVLSILASDEIKVVSFDIFDTLLCRPALKPTDIFYIIDGIVKEKYGIDFVKVRMNAESTSPKTNIDDIYQHIHDSTNIPMNILENIKKIELDIEKKLLTPRSEIKMIYEHAVILNKRIIATSDMYMKTDFLLACLRDSGYSKIESIYVSNEYGKRKDKGDLFDVVLEQERISPEEFLHIGDNYHSDFVVPLSKGIVSYLFPSISSTVQKENTLWAQISNLNDPFLRIVLGFLLNSNSNYFINRKSARVYDTCRDFGRFAVGYLLIAVCLFVQNNDVIQKGYKKIGFASRDGYLPYKAYSALVEITGKGLPSFYFESGRLLYYTLYNDTFDKFVKPDKNFSREITLNEYISRIVVDPDLKNRILNGLNQQEKGITIAEAHKWNEILKRFKNEITQYIAQNNKLLVRYYSGLFPDNKNIIFDCGYSGSIALALNKATDKVFDKLYLWHDMESLERDNIDGTKTISVFGLLQKYIQNINTHIIAEEVFTPTNSRPIKIDENLCPIYADEPASVDMQRDVDQIQQAAIDSVVNFANFFKGLTQYFKINNTGEVLQALEAAFSISPFTEYELLKNIVFDDFASKSTMSLAFKIEASPIYNKCKLLGCGLVNPDLELPQLEPRLMTELKMGVHVHVYNEALIYETIHYLSNLPANSGVYITTPKKHVVHTFKTLLRAMLPDLKTEVILTQNRGRDVAPLLVGVGDFQNHYDVFCHLHCKQSKWTNDNGESWRKYLFDNLLGKEAIDYVGKAFIENKKLGILSPLPFQAILDIFGLFGVDVFGENRDAIYSLMNRSYCGINQELFRADLAFSVGTMFWYRPCVFSHILSSGLKYSDFPAEPIGIDGTIAHAFERILKLACDLEKLDFRYMSRRF